MHIFRARRGAAGHAVRSVFSARADRSVPGPLARSCPGRPDAPSVTPARCRAPSSLDARARRAARVLTYKALSRFASDRSRSSSSRASCRTANATHSLTRWSGPMWAPAWTIDLQVVLEADQVPACRPSVSGSRAASGMEHLATRANPPPSRDRAPLQPEPAQPDRARGSATRRSDASRHTNRTQRLRIEALPHPARQLELGRPEP